MAHDPGCGCGSCRRAYIKGQKDFARSGGLVKSNPIDEFFNPTYAPPGGPKNHESYANGWNNAKRNKKR